MQSKTPKKRLRIKNVIVAKPRKGPNDWNGRRPSIEETGRGDDLCCLAWSGRLFRDDAEAAKECVSKFIEDYYENCKRAKEDPASEYRAEHDLNDLYNLIGIVPTDFGNNYVYEADPDNAQEIHINYEWVYPSENEIAANFGEPIFVIGPASSFSYPHERLIEF